jgi:hypothetical protein
VLARLQILRDRHWAHHDARGVGADRIPGVTKEPTKRNTRLLKSRLVIEHLVVGVVAGRWGAAARRHGTRMELGGDHFPVEFKNFLVELAEPLPHLLMGVTGMLC